MLRHTDECPDFSLEGGPDGLSRPTVPHRHPNSDGHVGCPRCAAAISFSATEDHFGLQWDSSACRAASVTPATLSFRSISPLVLGVPLFTKREFVTASKGTAKNPRTIKNQIGSCKRTTPRKARVLLPELVRTLPGVSTCLVPARVSFFSSLFLHLRADFVDGFLLRKFRGRGGSKITRVTITPFPLPLISGFE